MKFNVILIILLSIGCFTTKVLLDSKQGKIDNLTEEINRKNEIVKNLESDNFSLTFKKGELEEFIGTQNTQFKKDIDSVITAKNIEIKDLKKIINHKTSISVIDTVYLPSKEVEQKDDSLYVLKFSNENKCISASVEALTQDPNTKIKFEKLEAQNDSYYIVHKEKKKWWQIFKKRKLMITITDNCGITETKELEVK